MQNINNMRWIRVVSLAVMMVLFFGCAEFLEVDLNDSVIENRLVYSNDITATSAMTGVYADMLDPFGFASGSFKSVTALAGLSADEMNSYASDPEFAAFNTNTILRQSVLVLDLWGSMYKAIYQSNAVLEGLSKSGDVTSSVRMQLEAEAKFVRAFSYFYLVNLFGDVPLITTTDYRANAVVSRVDSQLIYEQILVDLQSAEAGLEDSKYLIQERARPDKYTIKSMLARVYLFKKDWVKADAAASAVINSGAYTLEDINNVFKPNSKEVIWQLLPVDPGRNTQEGYYFILSSKPVGNDVSTNALTDNLLNAFEADDLRKQNWINVYSDTTSSWYYPYKYKLQVRDYPLPAEEYSVVFRLAEQYLIRSEARARQNNLSGAIEDWDLIRERAGLPLIADTNPAISQGDILLALEHERYVELFAEWGHRWLDLKRTDRVGTVIGQTKQGWQQGDALYPIPESERTKNKALGDQNPGY